MPLPAWTYSQLDKFETCPKQFYHLRVAKDVVDPPSEHSMWGERVHKAFEQYFLEGKPLPEGMTQWSTLARHIASLKGDRFCEQKLAVDRAFRAAPWKDSWSRGIADFVLVNNKKAIVLDFKTGKKKPSEQLMLYAGYAFAHYDVTQVQTGYVWLKERKISKATYHKDAVDKIWLPFVERSNRLTAAYELSQWPARPSGLCNGWCPVKQCSFYKEKR